MQLLRPIFAVLMTLSRGGVLVADKVAALASEVVGPRVPQLKSRLLKQRKYESPALVGHDRRKELPAEPASKAHAGMRSRCGIASLPLFLKSSIELRGTPGRCSAFMTSASDF